MGVATPSSPANPNPWRHAADVLEAGRTYE